MFEHREEYKSQWAAVVAIADKFGSTPQTQPSCVDCHPLQTSNLMIDPATFLVAYLRSVETLGSQVLRSPFAQELHHHAPKLPGIQPGTLVH